MRAEDYQMTKVTEVLSQQKPIFICDFTPPRGADPSLLDGASNLHAADFVSVAYNPGKLVRLDSAAAAYQIRQRFERDVVFNLSPRDMNKIAIESHLLGASALGLENVMVLQGDPIFERDATTQVADFQTTSLIAAIADLNNGLDYRGSKLRSATDFCIGATMDPTRPLEREVRLARRKAEAGAHFLLTQPVFSAAGVSLIRETYRAENRLELERSVFWGVQVLSQDGILFSSVPEAIRQQVDAGRDGVDIALEVFRNLEEAGEKPFTWSHPS